jgi:UDP-4-amino-4-deoxy-L-arabinose formyltransferase/UDP-glucuronic acid dehydrogenase (UDP-4-keto-hexauronic acid decarboxylating)
MGHRCLEALLASPEVEIVGVCSHLDDPEEAVWFPSVAELARHHELPLHLSPNLDDDEGYRFAQECRPELILSFYYRALIPQALLDIPTHGAFNMHGSLLPLYRGRAPINWAILEGARETGVTLHEMVARADAGAIVGQQRISIDPADDAASLTEKATVVAVDLLGRQLPQIVSGDLVRRPQRLDEGFYRGGRSPEDGRIDWSWSAERVHNLVRALTRPWPGAFSYRGDQKLTIWQSEPSRGGESGRAGTLCVGPQPSILCGQGSLRLLRWEIEGEKAVNPTFLKDSQLR